MDWLRLALGMLSTPSQLSAELVGRSYGGGVLKVEPGELGDLVVPLVPVSVVAALAVTVNRSLRQGEFERATQMVDEALLSSSVIADMASLVRLGNARDALFLRRRRHRSDARPDSNRNIAQSEA